VNKSKKLLPRIAGISVFFGWKVRKIREKSLCISDTFRKLPSNEKTGHQKMYTIARVGK
jgi:hypothetical protein